MNKVCLQGYLFLPPILSVFPNATRTESPILLGVGCGSWGARSVAGILGRVSEHFEGDLEVWWPGYREDVEAEREFMVTNFQIDFLDVVPLLLDILEARVRKYPRAIFHLRASRICRLLYDGSRKHLEFLIPFFADPDSHFRLKHTLTSEKGSEIEAMQKRLGTLHLTSLVFPYLSLDDCGFLKVVSLNSSFVNLEKREAFYRPIRRLGLVTENLQYNGPHDPSCSLEEIYFFPLDPQGRQWNPEKQVMEIPEILRSRFILTGIPPVRMYTTFRVQPNFFMKWHPSCSWVLIFRALSNSRMCRNSPDHASTRNITETFESDDRVRGIDLLLMRELKKQSPDSFQFLLWL